MQPDINLDYLHSAAKFDDNSRHLYSTPTPTTNPPAFWTASTRHQTAGERGAFGEPYSSTLRFFDAPLIPLSRCNHWLALLCGLPQPHHSLIQRCCGFLKTAYTMKRGHDLHMEQGISNRSCSALNEITRERMEASQANGVAFSEEIRASIWLFDS